MNKRSPLNNIKNIKNIPDDENDDDIRSLLSEDEDIHQDKMYEVDFEDGSSFIIKLISTESNNIVLFSKQNKKSRAYKEKFSLSDLISIDRFFKMFETSQEVLEALDGLFINNDVSIDFDDNKNLMLTFHMRINETEKDISLRLLKHMIRNNNQNNNNGGIDHNLLNDLYNLVNTQTIKLDELQRQNTELRGKVEVLDDKLEKKRPEVIIHEYPNKGKKDDASESSKSEDNSHSSTEEKAKKAKKPKKLQQCDLSEEIEKSNILQSEKEINFIVNKINKNLIMKNKKLYDIKCIYRATTDGDAAAIFHKNCDGISPLLVFVKTTMNKRFGGFTMASFEATVNFKGKKDDDAFIFSLDKYRTYDVMEGQNAICCYKGYGPVFYGYEYCNIYLAKNFLKTEGNVARKADRFQTIEDFEINDGEQKFLAKEVEVFMVKIVDC